ncbi:MAG: class I tRNA ligase family protein, partial [Thermoplasmatales archaeon]
GADALRWYLISANAPWMSTRFYEEAVKETLGKFILTIWNSYNFFATYASLDKFDPNKDNIPVSKRQFLDKWILSRFNKIVSEVRKYIEIFEIHKAARLIENFVIDDFSNWYLRRSRKRLWVEEKTDDKLAGYSTMYDIFLGLSKILAPIIPFITEEIYLNIKTENIPESVHLCDYIKPDKKYIDEELEDGMERIRLLVEVGRALRSKIGIKVRYPLTNATLVCNKNVEDSIKDLVDLLNEEINVKNISFERDASKFMIKAVKPNHANLGPKYKAKAKEIIDLMEIMDGHQLYNDLKQKGEITINIKKEKIKLTMDDFQIVESEKKHIAKTETKEIALFIDTNLTSELEAEGFAREIVRRIQSMRKELNLDVEEKIYTEIKIDSEKKVALQKWEKYIKGETRSKSIIFADRPSGKLVKKWKIDEIKTEIGINK